MIKRLLLVFTIFLSLHANASNKILFYFNHPVDNSVSTGVSAVYSTHIADTLVAYINRARYTIDIAQYDYNQGSYASIVNAVNSAYTRGVQVRWIYDGSSVNTGVALLNAGIHTVGSPTSSGYGIMHNKYVVVDGKSASAADPVVWTGSLDWSLEQFNTDYNNAVVIQDGHLALAYTAEFNMMWGDTGVVPNSTLAKFGPDKTDLGSHLFTIDGIQVELYFSPSDGTNHHIQSSISSANTDLYFGMYTFTDNSDATLIVSKHTAGVYVAGINDSYSNTYTPHSTFTSGLGTNFIVYNGTGIYHNKFMIVDPSDACSDPQVLTGSHNWTISADTKNDENTLIIHDASAANIYYQSFRANFTGLGGTLSSVSGCPTAVQAVNAVSEIASVFPNPSTGDFTINYQLALPQAVSIEVYNVLGQKVLSLATGELQQAGSYSRELKINTSGVYFLKGTFDAARFNSKLIVTGK